MPSVRNATEVFFPLDEELQLVPGQLTPRLQESLVRLGTWMPFARAAKELHFFARVTVSEASARRQTQQAGAAYVQLQSAAVERLEREMPPAPVGPPQQLLSVDGAMVPLVQHEWAEVKTLVIGRVNAPVLEQGEAVVHSSDLSYFSRLTDAETFTRLALVEIQRRGTENAQQVCALSDGAEWAQRFIDHHCATAVRILDFPHAASYVAQAAQALWGNATPTTRDELRHTLHELKHGSPETVLHTLRDWRAQLQTREGERSATLEILDTSLSYLEKRRPLIAYARFQAAGYPIGSGSVESANKLVVEARLKGAGMHWARPHVDPMLALRNMACSERWDEAWPQITQQLRLPTQDRQARQAQLRPVTAVAHSEATVKLETPSLTSTPCDGAPSSETAAGMLTGTLPSSTQANPKQPYRPPDTHPWRRFTYGRALHQPKPPPTDANS